MNGMTGWDGLGALSGRITVHDTGVTLTHVTLFEAFGGVLVKQDNSLFVQLFEYGRDAAYRGWCVHRIEHLMAAGFHLPVSLQITDNFG